MPWFVYIVQCSDKTLYTGVTTDVARRVGEHNGEKSSLKGAKYTKMRRPVILVYQEQVQGRGEAQRREASLRQLSRPQKQAMIKECGK